MFKKTIVLIGMLAVSWIASADMNTGLIAYYPFNGNANDESGNENHGIVNNAVLTIDRNGKMESAYKFDGDGDSIELPNTVINGLSNMSFVAWFKIVDTGESALLSGANSSNSFGNEILINLPNSPLLYVKETEFTLLKTGIKPNVWYHIAVVRNGKTGKVSLYFNGRLDSSASLPIGKLVIDSNGLLLGREQDCVGGCFETHQDFNGTIDDVRIYARALSGTEVNQMYLGDLQIEGTVTKKLKSFGAVCENLTTGESVAIPEMQRATKWNCENAGLNVKADDRVKITIEGSSM